MSHWVVHEILNTTLTKPRKSLIKKFIEIAKVKKEQYHLLPLSSNHGVTTNSSVLNGTISTHVW
jgi:hypothetical protein